MILDQEIPELVHLRACEAELSMANIPSYGPLVVAGVNDTLPVHRWYRFKESFSEPLLAKVIGELGPQFGPEIRMLDPFCGAGTSLLAASKLRKQGFNIKGLGIERNPFIAFVARTKVNWPCIDAERVLELGATAIEDADESRASIPSLSSLSEGRCMSRYVSRKLIAIANAVAETGPTADAVRLGIASAIEPLSRVRKDGRALRLVTRPRPRVAQTLAEQWEMIAQDCLDLRAQEHSPTPAIVKLGDGRDPFSSGVEKESLDLIFTSPPYPNNIDYSEVYKLELWLLGFVTNREDFLKLRRSTFRSHPAYGRAELPDNFVDAIKSGPLQISLGTLLQRIEKSKGHWRSPLLASYFADMWTAVSNYHACLKPGGFLVMIVGNSLHGGKGLPYLVATDIVLSQIAILHGFKSPQINIARNLKRRLSGNHFLRESVVIMQKQ
jgi:SAM-dependent methyltransferase